VSAPPPIMADPAEPLSTPRKEIDKRSAVLHSSLQALVVRLKKKESKPAAEESQFVRDGKADVQLWLTDKSSANLTKLKELGLEIVLDPKSSRFLIGRIAIEKIEALAKLSF